MGKAASFGDRRAFVPTLRPLHGHTLSNELALYACSRDYPIFAFSEVFICYSIFCGITVNERGKDMGADPIYRLATVIVGLSFYLRVLAANRSIRQSERYGESYGLKILMLVFLGTVQAYAPLQAPCILLSHVVRLRRKLVSYRTLYQYHQSTGTFISYTEPTQFLQ